MYSTYPIKPRFFGRWLIKRFLWTWLLVFVVAVSLTAYAQTADPPRPPSLKTVPVPEPANLGEFVRDRQAAIALGKALFWDMQVGSDGVSACASCHFHSGADSRSKNQLSPGLLRHNPDGSPDPDRSFTAGRGSNHQLTAQDFPISPGSNDVVSSQGVFHAFFEEIESNGKDKVRVAPDRDGFLIGNTNVRKVEPRNTPSVINAVFNHRQFWDGRAQNVFNGVNGLGDRDPNAFVLRADDPTNPMPVRVRLEDSSLASQAVGPPVSAFEMSAVGRTFNDIAAKFTAGPRETGRRVETLRPLAKQRVHPEDSVLGSMSRWPEPGLTVQSYEDLIQQAFHSQWWDSPKTIRVNRDGTRTVLDANSSSGEPVKGYTLIQLNFALFFGIAVQMYEATLVANDSPYDRFMDGNPAAISALAVQGVDVFRSQTRGRCINCHEAAELTGASVRRVRQSPTRVRENQALDRGFNNIGILPTLEDLGVGGADPFGTPLSTVRLLTPPQPLPIAVDGAFKVPGLRNVELTAPYFHNGGQRTLRDALLFYSRGGDVVPIHSADGSLVIAPLAVLGSTEEELQALEAWLLSLTDERVRHRTAPFDHPQIFVPNGHTGNHVKVTQSDGGRADTEFDEIPAVGRHGGPPLPNFLEESGLARFGSEQAFQ